MLFEAFKQNRRDTPDAPAFLIASGDRSVPVTWKQFTDDIALVCWLIKSHAPESKICLLGENSYSWMVAHAACLFAGATVISLDTNLSTHELVKRIQFVGASILIYSSLFDEKAHEVKEHLPWLTIGDFGSRLTDKWLSLAVKGLSFLRRTIWDLDSVDVNRTSFMIFTSGTTSEPRAVELSILSIETFIRSTEKAVTMSPEQSSLMLLPLHHIYGICSTYAMLLHRVSLGVCPDFRRIYDACERFRVNFVFLVPALADILATKIARHSKSAEEAFGQSLDWVMTGGAPIARRTYEKLTALGIRTAGIYGLTETCACYSMTRLSELSQPCSAGHASLLPEVETRVSNEGELLVRGPNVMKGYYNMPEKTAAAIDKDGWFHTGDLGRIDDDGTVWVTGRLLRTIILSSGKKVSPEEIEDKIMGLPGVIEVCVSGKGEERIIHAEIYASVSEETIRQTIMKLNQSLPVHQRIKSVSLRHEPFPRTASGKIKLA